MEPFFAGVLIGLLVSVTVGPVFLTILQTGVERGFKGAVLLALGVSMADIIYVVIANIGVEQILDSTDQLRYIGVGGGTVLAVFGLFLFFKKSAIRPIDIKKDAFQQGRQVVKGFAINGLNPAVLAFWLGIAGMARINYQYSSNQTFLFFAGALATILSMDVVKSFLANKLRGIVNERFINIVNKVVGTALVFFGVKLVFYVLNNDLSGLGGL